jgi:prepilin-type N-terminal cleavage/methylation domain-containing protein
MRMNRYTQGAFTLIELVVSILILGLVMVVVAGILDGVVVRAARIERTVDADTFAGEVDDLIADDLAFIAAPPGAGPITITRESAGSPKMSFYSAAGATAAWGEPATPLHLVTYSVEPMAQGGDGLFRGEEPMVTSDQAYYDEPLLVAGGVTDFHAEAFDGAEWHERWPDEGTGLLPVLVRVTFTLGTDGSARSVVVESAPAVECIIRPQAQRRASGGRGAAASEAEGGEGAEGAEGESP